MFARAKAKAKQNKTKPKQHKQHKHKQKKKTILFCNGSLFLAPEFRPQKRKAKSAKRCDCLPH